MHSTWLDSLDLFIHRTTHSTLKKKLTIWEKKFTHNYFPSLLIFLRLRLASWPCMPYMYNSSRLNRNRNRHQNQNQKSEIKIRNQNQNQNQTSICWHNTDSTIIVSGTSISRTVSFSLQSTTLLQYTRTVQRVSLF